MLKMRQQTQNGVAYAKPRITKQYLITLLALPEMES